MATAIYNSPYAATDPLNGSTVEILMENVWTGDTDPDPKFHFHTLVRFPDGTEQAVWPEEVSHAVRP